MEIYFFTPGKNPKIKGGFISKCFDPPRKASFRQNSYMVLTGTAIQNLQAIPINGKCWLCQ